ncbi:MAG: cobalamin biosynthesis protein [Gammaproteobacteria bacterium]|nr:cobalamin biosynthesis protein [Gammaproteobacteria bacterium]
MIRIVSLTEAGRVLAVKLAAGLGSGEEVRCAFKPQPFGEQVRGAFQRGERLILICATGIAVRTLASVLVDKRSDPPVLVLDEQGQFVVPLVSGHEGGANEWGREVALLLGARLVLTTAAPYLHPVYAVGLGCERGCPVSSLESLLASCLARLNLKMEQVESVNSLDIKADEVGLIELSERCFLPFRTWSVAQLQQMETQLQRPSEYVFQTVGVYGVAESAALWAAEQISGGAAELVLAKEKNSQATCAIARAYLSDDS